MYSSSACDGAAEGKGAGRRTAIEDARVGKVSRDEEDSGKGVIYGQREAS